MTETEKVKRWKSSDYRKVAQIHLTCIDLGFLSSLGPRFLALLYESIDADEKSILILEKQQDKVIGFVAGGRSMKSIYRMFLMIKTLMTGWGHCRDANIFTLMARSGMLNGF